MEKDLHFQFDMQADIQIDFGKYKLKA